MPKSKLRSPSVSIIVVNWNGGQVFLDCLKSLEKLKYKAWELIIVDNGSVDASEEFYKKVQLSTKSIKLIKNKKNLGFAPANNQGFESSMGDYILLLNNDTKVSPGLLSILVNKMESDLAIGVIQPKIFMMDKKGFLDNAGSFMTKIGFLRHWGFGARDSKEFSKEREVFSTKGACMLIRREVIEKIGLFDKNFVSYFEESDFCWRAWILGYKVLFYPKTFIFHKVGFTSKRLDVININFHYYKNRINSLIKNLELRNLLIILTLHLIISAGISLVFLLRFKLRSSLIIWRAISWNILHLRQTVKERKQIQTLRKRRDSELFVTLMAPINWKIFWNDFKRVEKDLSN